MDEIIKMLSTNNVLLILGLLLVAILIFAILKQLLKLIYFMVILILLYGGYLYYTGQKIPQTKEELIQHGTEQMNRINKTRKEFQDKMQKEKKTKNSIDQSSLSE